ncbi:heat-inducible transcriptional repressor HrcA [Mycoplasmopsis agassizii]|uniref:Heat-inducible transcription repressor HrcA n=1 Tax=Mycoplasmopsis agassizii TaxID=33922 RepID=A0ABX4H4Z9_9BACT|nr:heat-inducible transcriptional repressor HrcA [Mycoplasmopsis agassizii]PAF54938.1 heat-inducible transcriptional repressor HrcA [Mycoplasmopsis agassizii]SMC17065.1 heat-inducible transcription repressor HrcA [Mycoplasmopsis agassizii]
MTREYLTDKQTNILKLVVDYYVETGNALGSKAMIEKFDLKVSSATIRNIMSELEELKMLEKSHISSGRIPSRLGLEYYTKYLAVYDNHDLKMQLEKLFLQRDLSIDQIFELAAQTISDTIGVTLMTSEIKSQELLKSLQLIPLSSHEATIILVTSSGNVASKKIILDEKDLLINLDDLRIAVKIFNDRLVNIEIHKLKVTAYTLMPILANSIHNYEQIMQVFIRKVFEIDSGFKNQIYGKNNLLLSSSIKREDLVSLLDLIEKQSIWNHLEGLNEDENIKIEIRPDHTSFISKRIEFEKDKHKEVTFVGDDKMDFAKTKSALLLIEEMIRSLHNRNILENKIEKENEDE